MVSLTSINRQVANFFFTQTLAIYICKNCKLFLRGVKGGHSLPKSLQYIIICLHLLLDNQSYGKGHICSHGIQQDH